MLLVFCHNTLPLSGAFGMEALFSDCDDFRVSRTYFIARERDEN